jgi:hypothetical protein
MATKQITLSESEIDLLTEAIGAAMAATIKTRNEVEGLGYSRLAQMLTERHKTLNELRYKIETQTEK